jgi:pimeloyl-ACP methyl ester carboxylesterase
MAEVSGAGPAVVLLHGQPGGRGDWAAVSSRLTSDRLVVAPDRPGYGETGGRARGFRGNAAAVVALLDRVGIGRATVVGYSWAGGVAIALAAEAPDRVAGLVLVSSVCPGLPLTRTDRVLAVPPIGTAVAAGGLFLVSGALRVPVVRRFVKRRQLGRAGLVERAEVHGSDAPGDDFPDPNAVVSSWRSTRVWKSFVTEQRSLIDELPLLTAGLAQIRVPTVVLQGMADRTVPPTAGRRLAAAIPGARLVELEGTGHLVILQRPDAVAAAVREVTPS